MHSNQPFSSEIYSSKIMFWHLLMIQTVYRIVSDLSAGKTDISSESLDDTRSKTLQDNLLAADVSNAEQHAKAYLEWFSSLTATEIEQFIRDKFKFKSSVLLTLLRYAFPHFKTGTQLATFKQSVQNRVTDEQTRVRKAKRLTELVEYFRDRLSEYTKLAKLFPIMQEIIDQQTPVAEALATHVINRNQKLILKRLQEEKEIAEEFLQDLIQEMYYENPDFFAMLPAAVAEAEPLLELTPAYSHTNIVPPHEFKLHVGNEPNVADTYTRKPALIDGIIETTYDLKMGIGTQHLAIAWRCWQSYDFAVKAGYQIHTDMRIQKAITAARSETVETADATANSDAETFGEFFKHYREVCCELTQTEMAAKLQVTEQTVRHWESNHVFPSPSSWFKINKFFHGMAEKHGWVVSENSNNGNRATEFQD